MSYATFKFLKNAILSCLCFISLGGIAAGLLLTVTKSPRDHAEIYTVLSKDYIAHSNFAEAQNMARMALSYQPYDMALWKNLEFITQQSGIGLTTTPTITAQDYNSAVALFPPAIK